MTKQQSTPEATAQENPSDTNHQATEVRNDEVPMGERPRRRRRRVVVARPRPAV